MHELLEPLFGWVCGQNPGHTWAPGGPLLPFCQRCTGLYVGAGIAVLLHAWIRPAITSRFLALHGACLLLMAPFGFHWVPQGPALRAASGVLFGFGVLTFLLCPLVTPRPQAASSSRSPRALAYTGLMAATCIGLPWLAGHGGGWTRCSLELLALVGGGALAVLAVRCALGGFRSVASTP